MKIKDRIKLIQGKFKVSTTPTSFGDSFNVDCDEFFAKGYNIIIVCKNKGYGLEPFRVLLPHQLYKQDIEKLLDEEPDIEQITIVPAKHEDYIDLLAEERR